MFIFGTTECSKITCLELQSVPECLYLEIQSFPKMFMFLELYRQANEIKTSLIL